VNHGDHTAEPNDHRKDRDGVGGDKSPRRPKCNHPSRQKHQQDTGDEQGQFEESQVHHGCHQEASDDERNIYLEPDHILFQLLQTARSTLLLPAVGYLSPQNEMPPAIHFRGGPPTA
jgi:hypothetical protein